MYYFQYDIVPGVGGAGVVGGVVGAAEAKSNVGLETTTHNTQTQWADHDFIINEV